jgi:type II secretory pathway component PulF
MNFIRGRDFSNQFMADFYKQLHALHKAGITTIDALQSIQFEKKKDFKKKQLTLQYLKNGWPLSKSGHRSGMLDYFDTALIAVGEQSGQIEKVLEILQHYYAKKARRASAIKNKMLMPLFILTIAVFLFPLPDMITGRISISDYISMTFGLVIICLMAYFIGQKLLSVFKSEHLLKFTIVRWLHFIPIYTPMLSDWYLPRKTSHFLHSLAVQLEAGVNAYEATKNAQKTLVNPYMTQSFDKPIELIKQGQSLSDSLSYSRYISHEISHQINLGEQSGKLSEMLMHLVDRHSSIQDQQDEFMVTWIPRIFYFIILVVAGYSIITSGAFMPSSDI